MTPKITLYNTLSRKIEEFKSIKDGEVSIYSCGPTVYNHAHIGNLRAYVFADTIRRVFISAHYKVKYIINITDVGHLVSDADTGEDKLEKGALREGKTAWEIAEKYTEAFMEDMETLGIPTKEYTFPRATNHITEQINLISTLVEKGNAYIISDGVYFDTGTFPNYADLGKLDIDGLRSGGRVEENIEKRNITDFALWKFSKQEEKRQMEWDSPWGKGFPGWHIECSAMSMKYLGEHFDIHTGGIDHIPVHHTNEIAQSEAATGKKFVNYWMHVNFLNDKDGKMAKSNNDFLTLKSLVDIGISAYEYRYFLLTSHYRAQIDLDVNAIRASGTAYRKLRSWCKEHATIEGTVNEKYKNQFIETLYDDISTPSCVAIMWELMKDDSVLDDDKYRTILDMSNLLGLQLHLAIKENIVIPEKVQVLLDARKQARTETNWIESDALRNKIIDLGYEVKDTEMGQDIIKINPD